MNSLLTTCFVYRKIILPCIVITGLTVTINNCLVSVNGDTKIRKRYLVHPPPSDWAATKMQLIAGLGLPMDVDVSTIIGYVVKFNYDLPYNASDLTEPYIRYQRSTYHRNQFSSRWEIYRMIESTLVGFSSGRSCLLRVICETAAVPFSRSQGILPQLIHILLTPSLTEEKYLEHTDQEFRAAELKGRKYPGDCHKIFPDCTESPLDYFTELIFGLGTPLQLDRESVIVGAFTKLLYNLPSNVTDLTSPGTINYRDDKSKTRWNIYKQFEKLSELYGLGGKICLLKAICQVTHTPFDHNHGLLGQLIQTFLTPSSTVESYENHEDQEYHSAEKLGRHVGEFCHALYPECTRTVLDVFSTTTELF